LEKTTTSIIDKKLLKNMVINLDSDAEEEELGNFDED
jgi:hypothetical protein